MKLCTLDGMEIGRHAEVSLRRLLAEVQILLRAKSQMLRGDEVRTRPA